MPRSALTALVVFLLLLAPAQTWLLLGGDFTEFLQYESLPGQVHYVLAKLLALYSIVLMWAQAMLGLLRGPLLAGSWLPLNAQGWAGLHRGLGLVTVAAVLGHVVLFVTATSLRNNEFAWDLLLPSTHGYYRKMVSLGAVALWLMLLAVVVQLFRLQSVVLRRWSHRLVLPALALVLVHSLTIGSESRAGWMLWANWFMGITLLLAVPVWLRHLRAARGGMVATA